MSIDAHAMLAALNSRPAKRTIIDADGHPVGEIENFPNQAAAAAAPVPDDHTCIISVDMMDLL